MADQILVAKGYRRGWRFTPLDGKKPVREGWQSEEPATMEQSMEWARSGNIGLRCGKVSGVAVVDIEADAKHLVDLFPETVTVETGTGGFHLYYKYPGEHQKNRVRIVPCVDVRSEGGQVVYPGSIQPKTKQPYRWVKEHAELAEFPTAFLADLRASHYGDEDEAEQPAPQPAPKPAKKPGAGKEAAFAAAALQAEVERVANTTEGGRNDTLNRAAYNLGQLVGGGVITRQEAESALHAAGEACGLPQHEVKATTKSGLDKGAKQPRKGPRAGWKDANGSAAKSASGNPVPKTSEAWPNRYQIACHSGSAVASAMIETNFRHTDGEITLRRWQESWYLWSRGVWQRLEDEGLTAMVHPFIEQCEVKVEKKGEDPKWVGLIATKNLVSEVKQGLLVLTLIPSTTPSPSWLSGVGAPTWRMVAFPNGVLDMATGEFIPPTPRLFNLAVLEFEFDAKAQHPVEWCNFISAALNNDEESIQFLHEFFGYCCTNDTKQHKALMLVGPTRSGKGTTMRILQALVGEANNCSPSAADLDGQYGLASLVGKRLAVVEEGRVGSSTDIHRLTSRILGVVAGDKQTVQRKYKDDWHGKLDIRLAVVSNDMIRFSDNSAAIAGRFIYLRYKNSHLGKEDQGLEDRLRAELPGIFNLCWARWKEFQQRGRFKEPSASADMREECAKSASPIINFVSECCEVKPEEWMDTAEAWAAWKKWCADTNTMPGTKQQFGQKLCSSMTGIETQRYRLDDGVSRRYTGIRLVTDFERNLRRDTEQ